jgi:hypothetical protein
MQTDTSEFDQARTGKADTGYRRVIKRRYAVNVNKHWRNIIDAGVLADCSYRNGALLAVGTVLIVQGVVKACRLTTTHAPKRSLQLSTGYLLQVSMLLTLLAHNSYHSTDLCWIFPT